MISRSRGLNAILPFTHRFSVPTRFMTTSSISRAADRKEVPVASYVKSKSDQVDRTVLKIDQDHTAPKVLAAKDASRRAVPFDQSVVNRLTPTMKMFTLEGKVALVTGYVP